MAKEYYVPVQYISKGNVRVEADSIDEAIERAEKIVANGHASGSIMSPSYERYITWEGAEAVVEGEEIDLDDMKYFED